MVNRRMDPYTKKVADCYDENVQFYRQRTQCDSLDMQINRFLKYLPGTAVLSIGCGYGRDEKLLHEKGLAVVGIDISEKMIELATEYAPQAVFYKMDMRSLDWLGERFDGVFCSASLLHLRRGDVWIAMKEMHRVLAKKGALYLSVKKGKGKYTRRLGNSVLHETLFEHDEMLELMADAGFSLLESFENANARDYARPWLNYYCRK